MNPKPINATIKGFTIANISTFRYGQLLHDQRFFELKFLRPLIGAPFSIGTDAPEHYTHQPISLQFEGAFGKRKTVSGKILKLEYITTAGQPPEVIVSGTMYEPVGLISKFTLALLALIVLPFLFGGLLYWQVSKTSGLLVQNVGTVSAFQDRSGKGTNHYTFKISPYKASFKRSYHVPVFSTARDNINNLFTTDGAYDENLTGQQVTFYTLSADQTKLADPTAALDFFYMRSALQPFVKFDYNYDLLIYTTGKTWFDLLWAAHLLLEVFFFGCALYCYKMYGLEQQQKNRIIWYSCLVIAAVLNIGILLMKL